MAQKDMQVLPIFHFFTDMMHPTKRPAKIPALAIGPKEITPTQYGDEAGRIDANLPEHHPRFHASYEIAFNEPGIVEAEPVEPFLLKMIDFTEDVIRTFQKEIFS